MIPAIELKMFAIDKKYRGLKLSETFLEDIYNVVIGNLLQYIGADALILYAVPSDNVVQMYEKSGFKKMPFDYSMYESHFDNGCIPMYKLIEF
jgi:ribosomal protein S18 acetylase RimI-like enzyme